MNHISNKDVVRLILKNTPEVLAELTRRHNMHTLKGEWRGSSECHEEVVAQARGHPLEPAGGD